ncbi:MAG: AraC family transcriptional regulator [Lentisphaerae bacterium]|nr:MAG: AraC family transcriptional regulator [Lentisphaerota bacterium]
MLDLDILSQDISFTVRQAIRVRCRPEWAWKQQAGVFTGFNLWFIRKGKGSIRTGGRLIEFLAGDCLLLRMWETQEARHDPGNPITVPFILFDILDCQGQSLAHRWNPPLIVRQPRPDFFDELMDHSITAFQHNDIPQCIFWLKAALNEYLQRNRYARNTKLKPFQIQLIEEICLHIRQRPHHRFTLRELAAECGYHPDYFAKLFKRIMGISPGEYMIRSRLQEADSLLLFSNYTISQIAQILGYPDEFTFSHQFRSRRGISPSQYRKLLLTGDSTVTNLQTKLL